MICNTYKKFFKTVGEPSRTAILLLLKKRPHSVTEIIRELQKEQSAISHNLQILKKRGFVQSQKKGKQRMYSLTKEAKKCISMMDKYVKKYFHKECKCGR